MSPVTTAAALVAAPVAAAVAGAGVAVLRPPGRLVVSGVQHLAAGIVVAAVAGEVLPDLHERGSIGLVVVGFTLGVLLMLGLQVLEARGEARQGGGEGRLPTGFLVVIGVDLLVDGLLVGAGAAVSTSTAVIVTVALTLEVLFLGVAVVLQLRADGAGRATSLALTTGLSLLLAVGAVLGAALLTGAGDGPLALVLSFSAAALLWLVVEELLVEAHEQAEPLGLAALFFLGFLSLYVLESLQ